MLLTCGGFPQLVKPSFLLGNHLWNFYNILQSTPSEGMLEPPVLLACLASVVRHNKNSILPLLNNLASKNHIWHPILLGKSLHRLVLQQMHGSSEVGNVLFGQLRLPEPSSCYLHSLKEPAHVGLILIKTTIPVLIWMLLTCGGFPKLVKPSFLLGNHPWNFYSIPDVLDSMPLFLLLQ